MSSVQMLTESVPTRTNAPRNVDVNLWQSAPGLGLRVSRLLWTLRYHRPGQLVRRATNILRQRLTSRLPVERYSVTAAEPVGIKIDDGLGRVATRRIEHRRDDSHSGRRAGEIANGRWTFLGQSIELGASPNWRSPKLAGAPRLWQFHLQYHDWLLDVAANASEDAEAAGRKIWETVQSWIAACARGTEAEVGDAWHPYCISRRIPTWLALWNWQAPPEECVEAVARNLAAQAGFLARRLERDLGGNHLLENARALLLAGCALRAPDADRWRSLGQSIIETELGAQLLPHGEHFERSPMYHCQMMEVLEDACDAMREREPGFSATCETAAAGMQEFIESILHPDGEIPLLGDSCFDEAPRVERQSPSTDGARQIGDYWVYRSGGDFLLLDAGPVGPDHLPAHAHADLLTIEASFEGVRFIVDSGVHDYEVGALRQYCRSTAAHNVLEIDGENQCDVWSRFRMGRRGRPTGIECGGTDGVPWVSATHNAYRHLGVHTVSRSICCCNDDGWLIADGANGRGTHTLVSRLHLHPEVRVERMSDVSVRLERDGVVRFVSTSGTGELAVDEGLYCPRFGEKIARPVIEARLNSSLPATVGWHVTRRQPAATTRLALTAGGIRVSGADGDRRFVFPVPAPQVTGG